MDFYVKLLTIEKALNLFPRVKFNDFDVQQMVRVPGIRLFSSVFGLASFQWTRRVKDPYPVH
jgi:hypothetical protein